MEKAFRDASMCQKSDDQYLSIVQIPFDLHIWGLREGLKPVL